MIKLNITDFTHYDSKSLFEFLLLQSETSFEITIPRPVAIEDEADNNLNILLSYLHAAYSGHRLANIAQAFAYNVPDVHLNKPFVFEIAITNMEKFADELYYITRGLTDDFDNDTFLNFQIAAAEFINEALEKIWECKTAGLMIIVDEYLQKQ